MVFDWVNYYKQRSKLEGFFECVYRLDLSRLVGSG